MRLPAAVLGVVVVAVATMGFVPRGRAPSLPSSLYSVGVGVAADGGRVPLPVGKDAGENPFHPGTRVLLPARDATLTEIVRVRARAAQEQAWLAAACVPGAGTRFADLSATALLDLRVLTLTGGAMVAGWTDRWRYVWPRDASAGAAALAVSGHVDDAAQVMAFLERQQRRDGRFEARYRPDGSGAPDDRGIQLDGSGWALWGLAAVARATPPQDRAGVVAARRALLDRSVAALLRVTSDGRELPPPSPDYWEVRERRVTLGSVAPMIAGLHAASELYTVLGEPVRARQTLRAAERLTATVRDRFAGSGYQRYPDRGGADSAVAMMMPPFQPVADPQVVAAFRAAPARLARPGGGLAPGEQWREQTVSWTPETALFALGAAASGDRAEAVQRLTWLDSRRTPLGSLPEKVLADGRPAGVAPLAWTAALVLLTLHELDGTAGTGCTAGG